MIFQTIMIASLWDLKRRTFFVREEQDIYHDSFPMGFETNLDGHI